MNLPITPCPAAHIVCFFQANVHPANTRHSPTLGLSTVVDDDPTSNQVKRENQVKYQCNLQTDQIIQTGDVYIFPPEFYVICNSKLR